MTWTRDGGSFRDPAGFVFSYDGVIYRQVNAGFGEPYRSFVDSGLYTDLLKDRLIVEHEEVPLRLADAPPALAVLRPDSVPFISYPYEWCFSQVKAAALLTLDVQKRALARGLILRDASAYNVQFIGARPVFIDTLSFGPYREGQPWAAYRQFCQHFLAPLAVMALAEPSLGGLTQIHIDGVPLGLATSLLPFRSRFKPGLLLHLHLHGRQDGQGRSPADATPRAMGRTAMLGLVDSLERTIGGLSWTPKATLWSTYSTHLTYSGVAQEHKHRVVGELLAAMASKARPSVVWDLGANTGDYSLLAAENAAYVVAFDGDRAVVEQHFSRRGTRRDILPLVQDLSNPSPSVGWNHGERRSLVERGPADVAMALAFAHHLVIGNNVPLASLAAFFRRICRSLIIEFVPKEDSQVQRMLALRGDVCPDYTPDGFERAFGAEFTIHRSVAIEGTARRLYLMERR